MAGDKPSQLTAARALLGSLAGSAAIALILWGVGSRLHAVLTGVLAAGAGMLIALAFVRKELNLLIHM